MTRSLGLDLGERRIGVAIADGADVGARPLVTLRRGRDMEADAAALLALIETHAIDQLVVGLPLEAAGHEGPQAARTRAWMEGLRTCLPEDVTVTLQDERLSSDLAESRLGPMKRGRSGGPPSRHQRNEYRARVDREAAAIILQDALDTRLAAGRPSRPTRTISAAPETTETRP